jgi:hypothetical protein
MASAPITERSEMQKDKDTMVSQDHKDIPSAMKSEALIREKAAPAFRFLERHGQVDLAEMLGIDVARQREMVEVH